MSDDLDGLGQEELLATVILELRALRRLIGAAFIIGVLLAAFGLFS